MVELVRSGRQPSDLSKEFGCHVTSILSWVRKLAYSASGMGVSSYQIQSIFLDAK
jgi:transposase